MLGVKLGRICKSKPEVIFRLIELIFSSIQLICRLIVVYFARKKYIKMMFVYTR